jgi:hypothetical protein
MRKSSARIPTSYLLSYGDRTFAANFALKEYEISVSANPVNGGSVTGGATYTHGESVTVQATPAAGYFFTNWTEDGLIVSSDSRYTFTAAKDRTLTANFSMQVYNVSLSVDPAGSGSVLGAGNYTEGQSVTVQAIPNTGYHFINWTEGSTEVSTASNYTFTINNDRSLVANFALNTYNIAVSAAPADGGTVAGAGTYNHGASVTVTATANMDYQFVNWTEGGVPVHTSAQYTFTATADRNLVANFALNTHIISVSAAPADGGTVSGAGTVDHGANVTVTATPHTGYHFTNWTEGGEIVSIR